jgi:hypothetical protein
VKQAETREAKLDQSIRSRWRDGTKIKKQQWDERVYNSGNVVRLTRIKQMACLESLTKFETSQASLLKAALATIFVWNNSNGLQPSSNISFFFIAKVPTMIQAQHPGVV